MRVASRVLVATLSMVLGVSDSSAAGVKWHEGSLASALQLAQAQQRLVLVDVVATWCAPCHQMDADLFPRDEVGRALASGYVAIRVDGEAPDGLDLTARYHVGTFPTLLVLDARGNEIERLLGAPSPSELVRALNLFRDGRGGLAELERELARAPTDALRFEVAMRHAMRADARAVAEIAEVVQSDPQNREHRAAPALASLGINYYGRGIKDYARADATLAEVERRFPTSSEAEHAPYHRAVMLQKAGRTGEARALLDAWIERAPRDVQRLASYAWFCFKDGGDRARGMVMAKRGLEHDPRNDALWDTLGELQLANGDVAEARRSFARAAEIAPKKEYYQRQLKKLGGVP